MADNPLQTGEQVAQGIPGVNILQMMRSLGEKMGPGAMQQIMQMLGATPPQPAPPLNARLPRYGGTDANGQPIIIPPGQ